MWVSFIPYPTSIPQACVIALVSTFADIDCVAPPDPDTASDCLAGARARVCVGVCVWGGGGKGPKGGGQGASGPDALSLQG